MNTKMQKPFYKKISFIVCLSVLVVAAIIALTFFVLITIRYNIYRNAVDAVNSAVAEAIKNNVQEFRVWSNGLQLKYWTTNVLASTNALSTMDALSGKYYLSQTFYLQDFANNVNGSFVQNVLDNSDNEIWVYLTKPLVGTENENLGSLINFKNLHGHKENLSFLDSALNGGKIKDNIAYIACVITFSVVSFVALVPVLFMWLAPKFANKKDKKNLSTNNVQEDKINLN